MKDGTVDVRSDSLFTFFSFLSFRWSNEPKIIPSESSFGCASFRRLKATTSKKFAATEGRKGLGERRGKNERELERGCKES